MSAPQWRRAALAVAHALRESTPMTAPATASAPHPWTSPFCALLNDDLQLVQQGDRFALTGPG